MRGLLERKGIPCDLVLPLQQLTPEECLVLFVILTLDRYGEKSYSVCELGGSIRLPESEIEQALNVLTDCQLVQGTLGVYGSLTYTHCGDVAAWAMIARERSRHYYEEQERLAALRRPRGRLSALAAG
jgi:hypothetical protein